LHLGFFLGGENAVFVSHHVVRGAVVGGGVYEGRHRGSFLGNLKNFEIGKDYFISGRGGSQLKNQNNAC
jgi:hypothetical protein